MASERQRIDKWLWHARVVRTRPDAAELAAGGHVRVNGERVRAASHPVKTDDVVTVALDRTVRVLKVVDFAERRGDTEAARRLFVDLSASSGPASAHAPAREAGAGRPTKQERRALERLRDIDDFGL
jgi:ribosome-associated heat shock protein Hsp15